MTGDFLDYMERLVDARALEDVWTLHRRGMAAFGFDRVIYGLTRVVGANGSLGDFDDALVLSNHDRAYNSAFISEQMFLDAPGLHWARANSGAIGWGALWQDERALPESQRRIVAFQRAMNVVAGYTLSIAHNNARTFAMFSLAGAPGLTQADLDATWAREGRKIWTMCNLMHLKVLSLPHPGQGGALSRRQREALEWFGDGKSYQDIATIMGVSMATVEKHLRLAREKLRVGTTAQALMKAAFQNQIYVVSRSDLARPRGGAPRRTPPVTGTPLRRTTGPITGM